MAEEITFVEFNIRSENIRKQSFFADAMRNLPETEVQHTQELWSRPGLDIEEFMCQPGYIRETRALTRLLNLTCHYCLSKNVPLQRCARCHLVYYCSPACQRKDWQEHHKRWCCKQDAPLDHPEFLPTLPRLLPNR